MPFGCALVRVLLRYPHEVNEVRGFLASEAASVRVVGVYGFTYALRSGSPWARPWRRDEARV